MKTARTISPGPTNPVAKRKEAESGTRKARLAIAALRPVEMHHLPANRSAAVSPGAPARRKNADHLQAQSGPRRKVLLPNAPRNRHGGRCKGLSKGGRAFRAAPQRPAPMANKTRTASVKNSSRCKASAHRRVSWSVRFLSPPPPVSPAALANRRPSVPQPRMNGGAPASARAALFFFPSPVPPPIQLGLHE